jgi:hypothetical protein
MNIWQRVISSERNMAFMLAFGFAGDSDVGTEIEREKRRGRRRREQ